MVVSIHTTTHLTMKILKIIFVAILLNFIKNKSKIITNNINKIKQLKE